jgi:hypothetical protein
MNKVMPALERSNQKIKAIASSSSPNSHTGAEPAGGAAKLSK